MRIGRLVSIGISYYFYPCDDGDVDFLERQKDEWQTYRHCRIQFTQRFSGQVTILPYSASHFRTQSTRDLTPYPVAPLYCKVFFLLLLAGPAKSICAHA